MRHHAHPARSGRDAMHTMHVQRKGAGEMARRIGRDKGTAGREPGGNGRSSRCGAATAQSRHATGVFANVKVDSLIGGFPTLR